MDSNLNFQYHTFGCKVNTYDTGLMQKKINPEARNLSSAAALVKDTAMTAKNYPVHILNTCAVRIHHNLIALYNRRYGFLFYPACFAGSLHGYK